ncbi:alpha/beta hydrolase [Paenibacillus aquistagni]|uniref:alpha/beta hydrolase n=1 Tax=Paenibacillus aquistagni TaxID=1852522 RepID=UPI00145A7015|nr:alpha/beta hydrolase [Paenibacillus aquistagni]NMM53058.1 alpha/beta hydrolase [Paenibacillus aquistagni]
MAIWISLGISAILFFYLWAIPRIAVHEMTRMKRSTYDRCLEILEEYGIYTRETFEQMEHEEIQLSSHDRLNLHGRYIEHDPTSNRVVLIVHGYTAALPWSCQFASMFEQKGFNILLVDQRRHGRSDGQHTTFGYHEKYDIQAWIDWIVSRKGEDCVIGLHGQSLGGGTVLEYTAIHRPQVRFIIADCPYSDLTKLMRHQLKKYYLPVRPTLMLMNRLLKQQAGFSMDDVSPIEVIRTCKLPILFIHGKDDVFVPTWMSEDLHAVKPAPSELLLIDHAAHAVSYCKNPKKYEAAVHQFIDKYLAPQQSSSIGQLGPL